MGKITTFAESDGWRNTLRFIWKAIRGQFTYTARTFCLYADRKMVADTHSTKWEGYTCKVITKADEMDAIKFGRLKLTPWRKWLEAGSRAVVVFKDSIPVAFGWTHFQNHFIQSVGTFDMGKNIAWLGPNFVHINHRGKGLQQLVILQGVKDAPSTIDAFITSVNTENYASLRSYEKRGFKKGLEVKCKSGRFTPPL